MPRTIQWSACSLLPLMILALPLACGGAEGNDPPAEDFAEVTTGLAPIPARGAAETLDVGEWNLEWFGSPGLGPSDEALQLENVRAVVSSANLDIWALEEIVSASQFDDLVAELPGYAGFVANDPFVADGAARTTAPPPAITTRRWLDIRSRHEASPISSIWICARARSRCTAASSKDFTIDTARPWSSSHRSNALRRGADVIRPVLETASASTA